MRCNLSGTYLAQDLGRDAWRLTRSASPAVDVFLRGTAPGAAEVLRSGAVTGIGIEWRAGAVLLTLTSAERVRTIKAQSAIVHEPRPQLYAALPLAAFDAAAQRFWRRVFRLARIPGGRYLLKILARRRRDRR